MTPASTTTKIAATALTNCRPTIREWTRATATLLQKKPATYRTDLRGSTHLSAVTIRINPNSGEYDNLPTTSQPQAHVNQRVKLMARAAHRRGANVASSASVSTSVKLNALQSSRSARAVTGPIV